MPPTDASAGAGPVPVHPGRPCHPGRSGPAENTGDCEDTGNCADTRDCADTLDLRMPAELRALFAAKTADRPAPGPVDAPDLLDHVGAWGPTPTPVGSFQLVPAQVERDLPVIDRWMDDPAVARFWQLGGSPTETEDHLRAQITGDGRSVPCLGLLDGIPMSYWEIYRADLDPLARRYPARPHDTGLHLLIGDVADRGKGLGSVLLRAVADLVLDHRPACARVVAEPDLHNTPSVAAFLNAGYRYAAEVDLPGKRAALMIRDRSLRHLM